MTYIFSVFIIFFGIYIFLKKKNQKALYFLIFSIFFALLINNFKENLREGNYILRGKITDIKNGAYTINISRGKFKRPYKILFYYEEPLRIGEKIEIEASLNKGSLPLNENGFNERLYYKTKNLQGKFYIKNLEKISFKKNIKDDFRNRIEKTSLLLNKKNGELFKSILLSDGSISEDKEEFLNLGLAHIFAVSGLHIGLIFLFISKALFFLPKKIKKVLSLFLTFFYIYLIGFPISAVRAFLMILFLNLSFFIGLKYKTSTALILSALINLGINPYNIFSPSFILSYSSVLSLVIIYPKLKLYTGKTFLGKGLDISLSIFIGTLPIQLYFFYQVNIISIIANLILIPLYSLGLCFASLLLIIPNYVFAGSLDLIFDLGREIGIYLNSIINPFILGRPLPITIATYYFLLGEILFLKDHLKKYKREFLCFIGILYLITSFAYIKENPLYQVSFNFIGQGDSCLIKNKNSYYLIDTGGSVENSPSKKYLIPYLKSKGINRIKGIFISHMDADHVEGIRHFKNIKVDKVYLSGVEEKNQFYRYIKENYKNEIFETPYEEGNLKIKRIYYPCGQSPNDRSMVLLVTLRKKTFLFTGDISKNICDKIEQGKVDVLKVPHHGSVNSLSKSFYKKLRPDLAVISVGKNNYGMPSQEVIKALEEEGAMVKLTSKGQVNLKLR